MDGVQPVIKLRNAKSGNVVIRTGGAAASMTSC
jgi:hypothetical protein